MPVKKMKKLLIINQIPTPYRTFMFNRMMEVGRTYGFEVEVAYQAYMDRPRRNWDPRQMDLAHSHFFSKDWRGRQRLSAPYFRLNYDLLRLLYRNKYSHILYSPVGSLCGWFVRFAAWSRSKKIYWIESNLTGTRRKRFVARYFKRGLLQGADCFMCPGLRATEYIQFFLGRKEIGPVSFVPNLVDIRLYQDKVWALRKERESLRKSFNLPVDQRIILAVGEVGKGKGIDQLIRAAMHTPGSYQIIVLGRGPLLEEWREWIMREKVEHRISLKGYCDEDIVAKHLAVADWFIHVARKDASPLACIEAICAGLPIAVSNQTGNQSEVLEDEGNGFSFDAEDTGDVTAVLDRMVRAPHSQLLQFANRSVAISYERFDVDSVLSQFFEAIEAL